MARSSILDFRILVVPGLHGSGPAHWQTRWQQLYPCFERVEQARWDAPDLAAWSAQLDGVLRKSAQPTLIVAHSFGCLAAIHGARCWAPNVKGALLVAPANPYRFGVAELLREAVTPFPAVLVASTNDPWMDLESAVYWAEVWHCELANVGALGHINADSGLGDWRLGLSLLQRLAATVITPSYPMARCNAPKRQHWKIAV
jgi:predicted alpha/beta hydrolase family esterase